jgi:hypothetical protein
MTQHQLQGRSEKEILWFQRRDTLKAAAAWVAMGGLPAAMAQQRTNIVELGRRPAQRAPVAAGPDHTHRRPDPDRAGLESHVCHRQLGLPGAAELVHDRRARQHAQHRQPAAPAHGRRGQRLGTGQQPLHHPAHAHGRHTRHRCLRRSAAAQGNRSYFCNCYGTVDMESSGDKVTSQASYHQSFWAKTQRRPPADPCQCLNHSDEELEFLAGPDQPADRLADCRQKHPRPGSLRVARSPRGAAPGAGNAGPYTVKAHRRLRPKDSKPA